MKLKLRKDEDNIWSFVEVYNDKAYYKGVQTIKAVIALSVNEDGTFSSEPYKLTGGKFNSLRDLQNYSILEWLKAKKPVYSRLDGGLIVRFIVKVDTETGDLLEEGSSVEVYQPVFQRMTESELPLNRVFSLPENVKDVLNSALHYYFSNPVSRSSFLERRCQ